MNASDFSAAQPPQAPPQAPPQCLPPEILELRIHGIKNTTPAEMLGASVDQVERAAGDDLGSFWVEKSPAPKRGTRREAYSWGNMTRSGAGPLAMISTLFVHIGWLLILPFGLCNVAYWTRRIPTKQPATSWRGGRGAPSLRLFALGLTLIYVTALASVSLDLIGVQCFPQAGTVCSQLPAVFDALAGLPRAQRLAILTLIPLGVMLLLYAISHRARVEYEPNIARLAQPRTQDESAIGVPVAPVLPAPAEAPTRAPLPGTAELPGTSAPAAAAPTGTPLLALAEFWVQARVAATTERLHVAAVLCSLALLLASDRVYVAVEQQQLAPFDPFVAWETAPIGSVGFALALLVLVLVILLVGRASSTEPDRVLARRRWAGIFLVGSALLLLAIGLTSIRDPAALLRPAGSSLPVHVIGLEAGPTLLAGILLGLSVAALGWRRGVPMLLSLAVLLSALAFLVVGRTLSEGPEVIAPAAVPYYLAAAALVAIEVVLILMFPFGAKQATLRANLAYEGWRGMGPGVVMLLALGVAMTLASLVVVGVAAYLAVSFAPAPADGLRTVQEFPLIVPPAYVEFGIVLLGILLVFLAVTVVILIPLTTKLHRLSTPPLTRDGGIPDPGEQIAPLPGYGHTGHPPVEKLTDRIKLRALRARRFAALTQRGEPLLGILAVTIGGGLAATVVLRIPEKSTLAAAATPPPDWVTALTLAAPSIAIGMLSASALTALGFIALNALTTAERPLGLLWDLICFLPRAGHPFGPPCYSDRVVPELNSRVRDWLEPDGTPLAQRRVVLSAHSLGAVLAVSTIFAHVARAAGGQPLAGAPEGGTDSAPRIGLVTYGTQLRAYFGRFFPELLGPKVLGTRPCLAPRLVGGDPWLRQVLADENDTGQPAPQTPGNLRAVLTPQAAPTPIPSSGADAAPLTPFWINLWRRTDFLGFPVNSYAPNIIDRGASEIEPRTYLFAIATHGNYPDVAQYDGAINDLLTRMLRGGVPLPPSAPLVADAAVRTTPDADTN